MRACPHCYADPASGSRYLFADVDVWGRAQTGKVLQLEVFIYNYLIQKIGSNYKLTYDNSLLYQVNVK